MFASVVSGGFFLHDNTSEFLKSTVQTTLDSMVPLSQVMASPVCGVGAGGLLREAIQKKND